MSRNTQHPTLNERRRRAFTLIELLVVIAVTAVLIALAVPAFQRAVQSGRSVACLSNLRQLGAALNAYLGEHNMIMPTMKAARASREEQVAVIDNTLDHYVKNPAVFACPADARGFAAKTGTSYFWNLALNGQPLASLSFLGFVEDHSRIPLLSDKEGFHPYLENKVNILYADGHATKELKFSTE